MIIFWIQFSYDKSANMEDGLAVTSNKSLNQEIVNSEYRILPSDITISFIHTQQLVRKQHLPHTFFIFLNFKWQEVSCFYQSIKKFKSYFQFTLFF